MGLGHGTLLGLIAGGGLVLAGLQQQRALKAMYPDVPDLARRDKRLKILMRAGVALAVITIAYLISIITFHVRLPKELSVYVNALLPIADVWFCFYYFANKNMTR